MHADIRNAFEFGLSRRPGFVTRQFPGFFRMPLTEPDEGIRTNLHGFEFFLTVVGPGIGQIIETVQGRLNFLFEFNEAFAINFVVQNRMSGSPLFHEFGENAGLICRFPFIGHLAENRLPQGFFLPERNDDIPINRQGFRTDRKRDFFPGVQDIQIVQAVTA